MRALAAALIACIGCSSHYMPRSRGRVAVSMIDGKPVYIRDGQVYEHGVLGGGLVDAVAGDRAAEASANEYHDHMRDGLIEMFGGMGAMLGGAAWASVEVATDPHPDHPHVPITAIAVAIVGTALMVYGSIDLVTAEPYRWDAINIFNDDATHQEQLHFGPPGAPAAPTAQAKASLHMRD